MNDPAFMLDSNICIYILEGAEERVALRNRVARFAPGEIVVSAIAAAEVARGRSETLGGGDKLASLFDVFPVVAFDRAAAGCFSEVPFKRKSFDRLIAAHALALDLTLVTANERDFSDIVGLRVENWTR